MLGTLVRKTYFKRKVLLIGIQEGVGTSVSSIHAASSILDSGRVLPINSISGHGEQVARQFSGR